MMSVIRPECRERPQAITDEDSSKSTKTKGQELQREEPAPRKVRIVEKKKAGDGANRKLWDYLQVPIKPDRVLEPEADPTEEQMQCVMEENQRLQSLMQQCQSEYKQYIQSSTEVLRQYMHQNIRLKENWAKLQINHLQQFDDINQKQQQLVKMQDELKNTLGTAGLVKKLKQCNLRKRLELQRTLSDKNKKMKRMFFYQSNCCFSVSTPAWPLLNKQYQPTQLVYRTDRFQMYKATNLETLEQVAVKLYYVKAENGLKMAEHEYRVHSKLDHPNIVKCLDFFEFATDKVCLVYEWADHTLQDVLPILDEKSAVEVFRMIVEGLRYLKSKQILQRNIKTNNIVLIDGNVKICNFYWALEAGQDWPELPSTEPVHLPPELKYSKAATQRLDMWSVGLVLYETLARTALPTKDLTTIRKHVRQLTCSEQLKRLLTSHLLTEDHQRATVDAIQTLLRK